MLDLKQYTTLDDQVSRADLGNREQKTEQKNPKERP